MKSADIRELSVQEIEKKIRDTRDELTQLRMRKQTGQVERPDELRTLRRDVARLETILAEKKQAETAA